MRILILAGDDAIDESFLVDVLALDGHAVERLDVRRLARGDAGALPRADAVFASIEAAERMGWLSGSPAAGLRLVVVSRFPRLLRPLAARKDIRLLLEPSTPGQVLASLGDVRIDVSVLDEEFDWSSHDARLATVGLREVMPDAQLGSIAALVARGLKVPTTFVALVDSERQRFLGEFGLPDDLRAAGGTPREWSFCQHVVSAEAPLTIEDASLVPGLALSPLVRFGVVRSYAGVPVRVDGTVVGTVCALSGAPRAFGPEDVATLELAAQAAEARLHALRTKSLPPSEAVTEGPPGTGGTAAVRPSQAPSHLVGTTIAGKYLVTAHLGEGGMSRVYLARDRELDRLVAIKVLDAKVDDRLLLSEARQLARVRHPCILQLFDWGRLEGGRPYLVLEYVRGETLQSRIRALDEARTRIPRPRVIAMLRNLSGALESLHGAGLVHGDVKPGNVVVDEALDRVVLIDFGLAINASDTPSGRIAGGTPGYSAPEQLDPANPTVPLPTLDVYALGALAYALLTHGGPFARLAPGLRILAQREAAFVDASQRRPDLGKDMDAVFARALDPNPAARYATVTALVDALDRALPPDPSDGRPTPWRPALLPPDAVEEPMSGTGTIAILRAIVARELGREREASLVGSLPLSSAAIMIDAATPPSHLVPTRALSDYLRTYAQGERTRIVSLGERLALEAAPSRLASFQIDRAPYTILRATESLFRRVHDWGSVRFTRETTDQARVEIDVPRPLAPEQCALIAGAIRGALLLVRNELSVSEVACVASGAPACAFEVRWGLGTT